MPTRPSGSEAQDRSAGRSASRPATAVASRAAAGDEGLEDAHGAHHAAVEEDAGGEADQDEDAAAGDAVVLHRGLLLHEVEARAAVALRQRHLALLFPLGDDGASDQRVPAASGADTGGDVELGLTFGAIRVHRPCPRSAVFLRSVSFDASHISDAPGPVTITRSSHDPGGYDRSGAVREARPPWPCVGNWYCLREASCRGLRAGCVTMPRQRVSYTPTRGNRG